MILSQPFIILYIMNTCSIFTGLFAVNNFKTYGQKNGLTNESYLGLLGSLTAVFNSIRFIWSYATDYYSYKLIYGILLTMQIILDFTVPLVAENDILFGIWVCAMLFCEGGHFTLLPNVLRKIYGENSTGLYGLIFSYTGICSILMIVLQGEFLGDTSKSYNAFFYFIGGLSCVSLLLLLTLFKEEKFQG